jgi:hypothetical protein
MIPYSWKKTDYANPGAMNYAFVPNQTLPAFSVFGSGNPTVGQLAVKQPQQVMTVPAVPLDGYGGLVAGQYIGQPLMDNS